MSDLVSRVLAAIEQTERLAKACPCVEFSIAPDPSRRGRCDLEAYAVGSMTEFDSVSPIGGLPEVYARHIAHNDPAAVLRRCAADRTILRLHRPLSDEDVEDFVYPEAKGTCLTCGPGDCYETREADRFPWPCSTVKALAEGYGISVEEETT